MSHNPQIYDILSHHRIPYIVVFDRRLWDQEVASSRSWFGTTRSTISRFLKMTPKPNVIDPHCDNMTTSRKEVLYDGYYYDITEFIHRHPGGSLINFYTEPGEDATQAIDQFHFRSSKKVQLMLKSFQRRPASLTEVFSDSKTLTKHQRLSQDFKELFEQLVAEGYFEPSMRHVILRLVEAIGLTFIAFGWFLQPISFPAKLLASCMTGFTFSRFGWIQHEGGHRSLTGIPKVDQFLQDLTMVFIAGGSSIWWNSQHNRHHAMPQRLQHDVDLAALPFVVFNQREVTKKSDINYFFVRYQGFLYMTLDLLMVTMAWKFYIHPRCQLRKKAYFEMALGTTSFGIIYFCGFGWFVMLVYWFAFFLALNFSLSHSHLEVADKPTHWIEYSLTHTANIRPSMLIDFFMGYLNYQIEHHLFPTMPQFRQQEISHRVKALAERHGLPYRVYGYFEACQLALSNLHDVGVKLTEKTSENPGKLS